MLQNRPFRGRVGHCWNSPDLTDPNATSKSTRQPSEMGLCASLGHLSAPADPHLLEAIFLSTQSKGPRASPCPDRLTKPMAQRSCCQLLRHNTHGRTVRQLRGLPTDGCNQYFNCKVTLGDEPTHEASKGEGLRVIWAHMSLLRNGPLHQQPQSPPKLCSH